MANETRIRADGAAGAIDANLSIAGTSMSSPALADIPVVTAAQYLPLTLFTTNGDGRITARETVYVTAHTAAATTATVVKAREGTTDQDWVIGDRWVHSPLVRDFGSGSDVRGLVLGGVDIASSDEFNDGIISANWTADVLPTGSCTWLEMGDVMSAKFAGMTANDISCKLKPITIASGGYVETATSMLSLPASFGMAGVVLSDGTATTSNAIIATCYTPAASGQGNISIGCWSGTITNITLAAVLTMAYGARIHNRLTWVAANTWRQQVSLDGISWSTLAVADKSFTLTPTHMGIFVSNWGGGASESLASFDYFRASA